MDDVLSSFLVKIAYQQDEKSRKDFDAGLKQVQSRAAEFGAKIGALPAIVSEATKRISPGTSKKFLTGGRPHGAISRIDCARTPKLNLGAIECAR